VSTRDQKNVASLLEQTYIRAHADPIWDYQVIMAIAEMDGPTPDGVSRRVDGNLQKKRLLPMSTGRHRIGADICLVF